MGNSLATRVEHELHTSAENYSILTEFIRVLEKICVECPAESRVEFKRPLEWSSPSLKPALFTSSTSGLSDTWVVTSQARTGRFVVSSRAIRSDGKALFQLVQSADSTTANATIGSFEYLSRVLKLADEHKLRELQAIIEGLPAGTFDKTADQDPLVVAFDALNADANPKKREHNQKLYKLSLVLNAYDLVLLKSVVQDTQRFVNKNFTGRDKLIDIQKVTEELQMLKAFCGKDKRCALLTIDWESDYTFSNGCKSPPWRQVFSEICYIDVRPMDKDHFIVTATRHGFFVNKGYVSDDNGAERLNYEPVDNITKKTLVDLIKVYSPHFAATIDKQEYLYHPDASTAEAIQGGAAAAEATYFPETNAEVTVDETDRGDDYLERRNVEKRATVNGSNGQKKASKKKRSEPSLKWRTLGLNPEEIENVPLSQRNSRRVKKGNEKQDLTEAGRITIFKTRDDEEFSESESEISSEDEGQEKRGDSSEFPSEYYQIQKLVKYLRIGNQTATIIAICSLLDFDLSNDFNQSAIRDVGGLETLINLLDTNDPKCKIGALKVLKEISRNVSIRSSIADLDAMQPLVQLLKDSSNEELQCLSAETIANCARNARNRTSVRRYGGIRKLVRLLKVSEKVAISGARALETCSKSSKNKEAIQAAGSIPLLATLLESQNEELLIPVVGILQECSSEENYRISMRSSGMIKFLVENLASKNEELQTHCASAIFKCAEDDETRNLVREYGGLVPLVNLLENVSNRELLVAATGAVWKCAQNTQNVIEFNKLSTIKKLVSLMENQPEDVLVNVVGALGACAKNVEGRGAIRESGGITPLVNLLTGTNQALLVNVTTAVGECALDCMNSTNQ